jgi:release factor glutamine methyltransferase
MENQEIAWLLKEKYRGVKNTDFEADCARLAAGEPLAYLIGHTPFLDCTIYLDSKPLIPRPETEYWTEQAIAVITASSRGETSHEHHRGRTPRILDLCAGSGAIGVAVAKAVPEATVIFAEFDPAHLPTITKNVHLNVSVNRNIQVIESDLFSKLHNNQDTSSFDFILTNPPYIDIAANTVDVNVAAYEPHLALFGGVAGMEIITRIIREAPLHLAPAGQLWIEHEPAQVEAIGTLASTYGYTCVTHPDQYGIPRVSVLSMAQ